MGAWLTLRYRPSLPFGLACAAVLAGCATAGTRWEQDAFVLADATLAAPRYLYELDGRTTEDRAADRERLGLFVHRLAVGEGTILALRRFDGGGFMVSDDESFEKLTIYLPPALATFPLELSLAEHTQVVVVVTQGGSAWVRDACSGHVDSGQLSVQPIGRRLQVRLSGRIEPVGNRDVWPHCKEAREIDFSFLATPIMADQLTPWLGLAGKFPYQESYRPTGRK